MTVVAFIVFALSHAALIVLFEKQRKKIQVLEQRSYRYYTLYRRYRKVAQQQERELQLAARTLTK